MAALILTDNNIVDKIMLIQDQNYLIFGLIHGLYIEYHAHKNMSNKSKYFL